MQQLVKRQIRKHIDQQKGKFTIIAIKVTANPKKVEKTLIFGGSENQKRSQYKILSWQSIK